MGTASKRWVQYFREGLSAAIVFSGLLIAGTLASSAGAQTVADCTVPPSALVLNGRVICRAFPPAVNPRGLELTDINDAAAVDTTPFPIPRVDFVGSLEFNAASGDGPPFAPTSVDKFYIVSEQVANAPPANRPPLAAEIFGPFFYGSLTEPVAHMIDAATMQAILAIQAQNPNNLMILLEIPQAGDVFTGGAIEFFGGIRFVETIPPAPDFIINELSLNAALPSRSGPTNFDSTVELQGDGGQPLTGWDLQILDSMGNVVSTFSLDGNSTNSDGYFSLDLNLPTGSGGVVLQENSANQDALVFVTDDMQVVDPNLLAVLTDPGQAPLNVSLLSPGDSFQIIPDGIKTPLATDSFLPYGETLGAMNLYVIINEIEINTADSFGVDDQFVELYDGNRGMRPLDGLVFVSLQNNLDGGSLTVFNSVDLDGRTATLQGYDVIDPPVGSLIPTQSDAVHRVAIYETDNAIATGTPEGDIPGRRVFSFQFASLVFEEDITLPHENSNGHPTRDSLQLCPDASQLGVTFPLGNLNVFPPTQAEVNRCAAPEPLAETESNNRAALATEDPVNTESGEYYTGVITDISLGGPLPLTFKRRYASLLSDDGRVQSALGPNWMHDFEVRLTLPDANTVEVIYFGGRVIQFTADAMAPGGWRLVRPSEVPYQLVETSTSFWLMDPLKNRVFLFDGNILPTVFGRLLSIQDRNGNALTVNYQAVQPRRIDNITDGLGRLLTFTYTSSLLTAISDGTRNLSYGYFDGNLVSYTNARGHQTTYQYDTTTTHGPLLTNTIRPEANAPLNQAYNSDGEVLTQLDALGNGINLQVDMPVDGQTTVTDPTGTQLFTHEPVGHAATRIQDRAGNATELNYDAQGRLASVRDRVSGEQRGVTEFSYQTESGKLETYTDAEGNTFVLTRDPQQQTFGTAPNEATFTFYNLTRIDNPDGTNHQFSYDGSGNVIDAIDRAGQQSTFTYNAMGQMETATNPTAGVTTFTYNADGTLQTATDSQIGTTTFEYNGLRRVDRILPPQTTELVPPEVLVTYNNNGQITAITDENSRTTAYVYDTNGNLTSITDPAVQATQFGYNLLDNLTTVNDRVSSTTTLLYNDQRRPASLSDGDNIRYTYDYDVNGNLVGITNAGNSSVMTFNEEGIPASLASPLGRTATYETDRLGRLTAVVDPLLQRTEYAYDSMGRLTDVSGPSGNRAEYSYDARGALAGVIMHDDEDNPVSSTSYTRDNAGFLTNINDFNNQNWTFVHSNEGRLSSNTDPISNQTTYSYDARGRVGQVDFADGDQLTYSYDPAGNLVTANYQSGLIIGYSYDNLNRLTATNGVTFQHDAEGRVTRTESAGVPFDATYTPGGRLNTLDYNDGQFSVDYDYDPMTGLLSRVSDDLSNTTVDFFYDADRKLIRIERSNGTETRFSYDLASRLTRIETENTASTTVFIDQQFTIDGSGKITGTAELLPQPPDPMLFNDSTETFMYDSASQVNNAGFTYDARGRRTAAPGESYQWDALGRVTNLDGITFTNNGLGDPLTQTDAGGTTRYHHQAAISGRPVVAEQVNGGPFQRFYIWSPGGTLLYMVDVSAGNAVSHFHLNQMGSTLALTDASGSVTDSYLYSPYGELLARNGASPQPFTYHGGLGVQQLDSQGRYYRMGVRIHDSQTASFLSREPLWPVLASPDLLNPYQFALGNPTRFSDAEGLVPENHTIRPVYRRGSRDSLINDFGTSDKGFYVDLGNSFDLTNLILRRNALPIVPGIVQPDDESSIWISLTNNNQWIPPLSEDGSASGSTAVNIPQDSFFNDTATGFSSGRRLEGDDLTDTLLPVTVNSTSGSPLVNSASTEGPAEIEISGPVFGSVFPAPRNSQSDFLTRVRLLRRILQIRMATRSGGLRTNPLAFPLIRDVGVEESNIGNLQVTDDLELQGRTSATTFLPFTACEENNSSADQDANDENGGTSGISDGEDPKELDDGDCVL